MKALHTIAWILLVIGGLNWGLAAFDLDLANLGLSDGLLNAVYVLVGLSALFELFTHKSYCRNCESKQTTGSVNPI